MKQEKLLTIIRAPHLSEKAALGTEKRNEYVFHVATHATKALVKQAVEKLFKTEVKAVRIVNVKAKPKRFGKIQGYSKAWKKAYVSLAEGKHIEFVNAQ